MVLFRHQFNEQYNSRWIKLLKTLNISKLVPGLWNMKLPLEISFFSHCQAGKEETRGHITCEIPQCNWVPWISLFTFSHASFTYDHLYANCKLRQPFVIEVPSDHFVSVFLVAITHLDFKILLKAYMVARYASLV